MMTATIVAAGRAVAAVAVDVREPERRHLRATPALRRRNREDPKGN
jgi:hypothetical protein